MERLKFLAFFLVFTTIFVSCNKDDDENEPAQGKLKVYVKLLDMTGAPVEKAYVALANSESNLNKGYYIVEIVTDENGLADFGSLNPKTYFFDCYTKIDDKYFYAKGQAAVKAGANVTKTLVIEEE